MYLQALTFAISTLAILLMGLSLSACTDENTSSTPDTPDTPTPQSPSLTAEQEELLQVLREEEKLAYELYTLFYKSFPLKPFENIPRSEQRHQDRMVELLDAYNIPDPVPADAQPDEYVFPELQALYDSLVSAGSSDEIAALKVGAFVEESDINDLENARAQFTQQDITSTLSDLRAASTHHLNAFVSQLEQRGVTYEPQVLDQQTYDEIIADGGGHGKRGHKKAAGKNGGCCEGGRHENRGQHKRHRHRHRGDKGQH